MLSLAALFLGIYGLALSLSPAVRARSWQVTYRWEHWLGFLIWVAVFSVAHWSSKRWLPDRDPYLLPVAGLLSGWGVLTIWRLMPTFGLRQSLWLCVAGSLLILGMRLPTDLGFLRRFKYLWLTGSLLLTALTLWLGTNPLGYGPRMWLGCCGVYLQPSEPLKLMLIAYLAAYLADRYPFLSVISAAGAPPGLDRARKWRNLPTMFVPMLSLLAPTFVMVGLAIALLAVQRDLGTATIFLFLYAVIVYLATGRKRFLGLAFLAIVLAGVSGYWLFDVVRVRVDAWLNPWLDPSGRSFQIVQSLLAVANGGLFGRGPGVGNPGLVPVVHSDMIYAAIAEEQGLVGTSGLLLLLAVLTSQGVRAAFYAADAYQRYLAAGLTAYLVGQSLLIIGGTLRLLPLTGITLPFVSYGGSSLVTSFLSLLLLLQISVKSERSPVMLPTSRVYQQLGAFLLSGLFVASLANGWWGFLRGPALLTRTDNPRRALDDRSVRRGAIVDLWGAPINLTIGTAGAYTRHAAYPDLSNVVGYTNPTYGQSGLEASLDEYLRGMRGNSGLIIWWNHLLYGQPPPGLDVRLSLDLHYQYTADQLLSGRQGALVMLNAQTGEILAMASHPTFNADQLSKDWDRLIHDPTSPLLDRAVDGQYPIGWWQEDLFAPVFADQAKLPVPKIDLAIAGQPVTPKELQGYSPLQVALLACAVNNQGVQPAPVLVTAINIPAVGWMIVSPQDKPRQILSAQAVNSILQQTTLEDRNIWQSVLSVPIPNGKGVTWYIGGTLPGWDGTPLALALLLEEDDPALAEMIGQSMLNTVLRP